MTWYYDSLLGVPCHSAQRHGEYRIIGHECGAKSKYVRGDFHVFSAAITAFTTAIPGVKPIFPGNSSTGLAHHVMSLLTPS